MSLRELAARVHYGKSYLSDLEHCRRHPTRDVATRLDAALDASGSLVDMLDAGAPPAAVLSVAIAVVVGPAGVLLGQRRTPYRELNWQFPAGIVKPDTEIAHVAIGEVAAETGVYVSVRADLGQRVHPITGVLCHYLLCDHLSGQVRNLDPVENAAAVWAPPSDLTRYVPAARIFPPVLAALTEEPDSP